MRGLSPYPAAWTTLTTASGDELQLKIFKTSVSGQTTLAPGSIVIDKDRMYIACNDRLLEILSLQLQGKKRLDTADFLRGFNPDNFKL